MSLKMAQNRIIAPMPQSLTTTLRLAAILEQNLLVRAFGPMASLSLARIPWSNSLVEGNDVSDIFSSQNFPLF